MTTRRRFLALVAACSGSLPLSRLHAGQAPEKVVWRGTVLGAPASMTLVHADRALARAAIDDCVEEIARLETIFSLYRANSAITRLNARGELHAPPHELVELLSFALALSVQSRGAFDPTVQPLYRLYAEHFANAEAAASGPSSDKIAQALGSVDYTAVETRPDRIRLRRPNMGITLNGVAQGYITDRVTDRLRAAGFDDVLIDLGEARALGRRADGRAWRAAVRDPRDATRTLFELPLGGARGAASALATSAGQGTQFGADPRIHHLFDPRTGRSANYYLSVSVIAPRATIADGLSTALSVTQPAAAQALFAAYPSVRAYLLAPDGGLRTHAGDMALDDAARFGG
ncbi:MAG TPA: FAD:protein FMN transferase [Steroidobacter sp.]|jgi:thiamine biosynthesis lipoprotein|nr:FAD:protein FMN transferase [Steroidobacteraceae bacterium]HLS80371.1 FAD:protein FMN transferase [Steroidobacter sp.]